MEWWHKVVRRVWCSVSARVNKARKNGGVHLKLHDDVQTCEYEDVRIMWEMLRRTSESEMISRHTVTKRKNRWFWRNVALSSDHGR